MTPRVSVLMPAYNAARYLADAIRSVQAQTESGWELIVVDDGSTDATASLAAAFAADDARVAVITQANHGQGGARNAGLRRARAPWVAFLDADDLWMPAKLARQLQEAEEGDAGLIYTGGYLFPDDATEDVSRPYPIVVGRGQGEDLVRRLYRRNFVANLSVLARREALLAAGGLEEDRRYQNGEDYDLWLRLASHGCIFQGLPDALFRYRRHTSSATGTEVALLRAELAVLLKNAGLPGLDPETRLPRLRSAYRSLVAALGREGRWDEARDLLDEWARRWDPAGRMTWFQQTVMRLAPRRFNQIMTPLYRIGGLWTHGPRGKSHGTDGH